MSYDAAPDRLREARASGLHLLHKPVQPIRLRARVSDRGCGDGRAQQSPLRPRCYEDRLRNAPGARLVATLRPSRTSQSRKGELMRGICLARATLRVAGEAACEAFYNLLSSIAFSARSTVRAGTSPASPTTKPRWEASGLSCFRRLRPGSSGLPSCSIPTFPHRFICPQLRRRLRHSRSR